MTLLVFTALLFTISFFAGIVGALTGLGGGVVVIPALVLLFHVDMRYAMGASLISVIATSSGTAIAYMREGYTNLRIGLFLETGAIVGAIAGALLVTFFPTSIIAIIFGIVLIISAYLTLRRKEEAEVHLNSHPWAVSLRLNGSYPAPNGDYRYYQVQNVPTALGIMSLAGMLSGLLGIGSGALKVLAMDHAMRLPYKVATTTSNFIIGITAAVSAGVYFAHGYIVPNLAFPVMSGVLLGAIVGAKVLTKLPVKQLRIIFSVIILFLAVEMMYKGLTGEM